MVLEVLVFESPWSDDLADEKSVRLFIRGWADISMMKMSYRMYHDEDDLARWINRFISDDQGCKRGVGLGILRFDVIPKKVVGFKEG